MIGAVEVLKASVHGGRGWKPFTNYHHAKSTHSVPVSSQEIGQVAINFPMAFTTGDQHGLVAILGLEPSKNLFVSPEGRWMGRYTPAVFRAYPFRLATMDSGEFALAFDTSSGAMTSADEGEPFFSLEGQATQKVQDALKFLVQLKASLETTIRGAGRLFELDLLEPWPLKLQHEQGSTNVEGLYRVNEQRLNALDAQEFQKVREYGLLPLIYAQLISMTNISQLAELARLHGQHSQTLQRHEQDVKSMFSGDVEDEQIDWDAVLKTN